MIDNMWKKNVTVVGITGYARSGKDTIGNYLIHKYDYVQLAFATPLKAACGEVFSLTWEQLHGDQKETVDPFWGTTPRKLMQFTGTDLFRNALGKLCPEIGGEIWVKALERKMQKMYEADPEKCNKFVITDVRFPNECAFIKRLGGCVIRVNRHKEKKDLSKLHASERYVPKMKVDRDINNHGTIKDLCKKLDPLLLELYLKNLK